MKLHSNACAWIHDNVIICKDTSSVCNECFTEEGFVWHDKNQTGLKNILHP